MMDAKPYQYLISGHMTNVSTGAKNLNNSGLVVLLRKLKSLCARELNKSKEGIENKMTEETRQKVDNVANMK